MNIATRPSARSFLLVDRLETPSSEPGCLKNNMKSTKKAIGMKPSIVRYTIDKMASASLRPSFSPSTDRATWPPPSMAAGSRLSVVTSIPVQPAKATGCKSRSPFGGALGIRLKLCKNLSRIFHITGTPISLARTWGEGMVNVNPMMLTMVAIMKPVMGPSAPTPNSASLFGGRDFCMITAPKVPSGGGPGIKYGGVAAMPFLFAVILWPIS